MGAPVGVSPTRWLGSISAVDITPDGARLVAGTDGGDLRLVDRGGLGMPLAVMSHQGFVYESRFDPAGRDDSHRVGRSHGAALGRAPGEALSPGLPAGELSRSAAFLDDGRQFAWTGTGVMVDEVTVDDRSRRRFGRRSRPRQDARCPRPAPRPRSRARTFWRRKFTARGARPDRERHIEFLRSDARTAWLLANYPAVVDEARSAA